MIYNTIIQFDPKSMDAENEMEAIGHIVRYASAAFGHKVTASDIRLENTLHKCLPDHSILISYKAYGNNNGTEEELGDLTVLTPPYSDMKTTLVDMINCNK